MAHRTSYIVTKALDSYLKGSVIVAISGHFVTTSDAVVVSWLIGSKAFTAVNIVIPILTLFSSLMIMLSVGASISISKGIGTRNRDQVNQSFSSSVIGAVIIGVVSAVLTYKFTPEIVKVLSHGDPTLTYYANQYLRIFCFAIPLLIIAGVIGNVVRTDGNSRLVSIAVWIGLVINVGLDILFVGPLKLGVAGAAWASAVNYLLVVIICLFHFGSRNNTIRWSNNIKRYLAGIWKDCKLGFSTSLSNLLLAVSLFVINSIMLHYEGNEGIYCWAVCYQIFLILQMLLSGIDTSIFAIGGTLLGEDDVVGLNFLYKRSVIYLIIGVGILIAAIVLFPEFFGRIFGNRGEDKLDLLPGVLKIFSLFLLPYALIMQVRAIYTILERSTLSLFLCIAAFALMMVLVYLASFFQVDPIWWSFPISSWFLLLFLVVYTAVVYFRNKNVHFFSLIPKQISDPSFNVSVALDAAEITSTENEMTSFLQSHGEEDPRLTYAVDMTGKVMDNILDYAWNDSKKKRYFDVNVRVKNGKVLVIMKDDGKRLDRLKELEIMTVLNQGGGNNTVPFSANYFYMNEQNTFTLSFG